MKMTFLNWKALPMVGVLALATMGCKEDEPVQPPAQQTVLQIAVGSADFDVLEAAALKAGAGVTGVLGGTTQITVFAPTDAAFVAYLGVADEAAAITAINGLTSAQAADILTYHVIAGSEIKAAAVPAGPNAEVTTARASNNKAYVTRTAAGVVSINGATVATADVDASNGVVHVINQVLRPPVGTVVATAQADSRFELLVAAVVKAGLVDALNAAGPLTVFAPTDDALLATLRTVLSNPSLTEDQAKGAIPTLTDTSTPLNVPTLRNILLYHVVSGRNYSALLTAGNVPTLLTPRTVAVALPGTGVTVTGGGNGTNASNVIIPNFTTTNGVIHVIDRVLLPAQ